MDILIIVFTLVFFFIVPVAVIVKFFESMKGETMSSIFMQIGILLVCAGLVVVVVSFADQIDGTTHREVAQ